MDKLFTLMDAAREGYNAAAKDAWKKEGMKVARRLASGLQGPVSVRFNAGGVAVSGEVYLDAPGLKLWFEAGSFDLGYGYYREEYERGPGRSRFMGMNRMVTRGMFEDELLACLQLVQARGIEMMQADPRAKKSS